MQQSTQAHLGKISLSYRLKLRLKQFLKRTIGGTRLYQAIRVGYIWYTKSKRQVSGKVVSEKHKAKKKAKKTQQVQEAAKWKRDLQSAQFFPLYYTQEPTPELHALSLSLPVCGGSSVQVERPGDLVRQYHQQHLAEADTNRIGIRPVQHLQHLIEPEIVPDEVGVTAKEAEFLLDQHFARVEEDPDQTIPRLSRIQKVG